jgi:ATP-dependent DNA helicase PIF1
MLTKFKYDPTNATRRRPKRLPSYWSGGGGKRRACWDVFGDDVVEMIFAHFNDRQLAKLARCNKRTRKLARTAARAYLGLSPSQHEVYRAVLERRESILLMGPPGSGKSFLLNVLKKRMPSPLVTASTGAAAEKVGASTFHSAFTLGLGTLSVAEIMRRPTVHRRRMLECRSVILDEIGMLTAHVLDLGAEVMRQSRGGLVQFVASGDPMQLRAVAADADGPFYKSALVKDRLRPYILRESHRQSSKSKFLAILQRARMGNATERDVKWLNACSLKTPPDDIRPPKLVCTNAEAHLHNGAEMARLASTERKYGAVQSGHVQELASWGWNVMPFEETVTLKVGTRVLLTVNLRGPQYEGLHNGSTGVVTVCATAGVTVCWDCGLTTNIERHRMDKVRDKKVVAWRAQLPLIVAFAISIHRAQGATLDLVAIQLEREFAAGQAYVALSRARRIDTILLSGLTLRALNHVDKEALAFYNEVQKRVSERMRRRLAA